MENLHYIILGPIYKVKNSYYFSGKSPVFTELNKHFKLTIHSSVKVSNNEESDIVIDKRIRIKNFLKNTKIFYILKNFLYYKKEINKIPKKDYFLINYPGKRLGLFLAFILRKRKLVIWVRNDLSEAYKCNQFAFHGISLRAIINLFFGPIKSLFFKLLSKLVFRNNLIFYTGNITLDKKNHLNQYEIISCSSFNRDGSLVKKELNFNICFIGSEKNKKGLHILLKALKNSYLFNKITLNIIGFNNLKEKSNLKLAKDINIKFHGRIYNRENFFIKLSQNDILIMPSFSEKQGKVQLEAMSVGVVPVCSDSGGVYTTIKNYYNGLLFKEGDWRELRRKIELLYSNNKLYENIKENGTDYVSTLSAEKQVEKMSKIIKNFYINFDNNKN